MDVFATQLSTLQTLILTLDWLLIKKLFVASVTLVAPIQLSRTTSPALWPFLCGQAAYRVPELDLPDFVAYPLIAGLCVVALGVYFCYFQSVSDVEVAEREKGGVEGKEAA